MKMEKHGKQNGDNYRNLHINGRRNVFSHPNLEQTIGAINIVVERPKEKGACGSQRRRRGATATATSNQQLATLQPSAVATVTSQQNGGTAVRAWHQHHCLDSDPKPCHPYSPNPLLGVRLSTPNINTKTKPKPTPHRR